MDAGNHPLLRSLNAWAATRDDVHGVRLIGSREAEEGSGDSVDDFDVELRVDDPRTWHGEGWLEEIAPVLVAGEPASADDPSRLVFFAGQQRVDFRIVTGGPDDVASRGPATTAPPVDRSLIRDLPPRAGDASRPDAPVVPGGTRDAARPAPPVGDPAARDAASTAPPVDDTAAGDAARTAPRTDVPAGDELLAGILDALRPDVPSDDTSPIDEPGPAVLLALLPVFTAPDVAAWLAHYRALGFDVHPGDDGTGVAVRDGMVLRVVPDPDGLPAARGLVLAVVDDPEALAREWSAVPGGRTATPRGDGPRRWSHVDPAGNVLRFGAPG